MEVSSCLVGADCTKILSSLIEVGAVWGGYLLVNEHRAAHALRELLASTDVNGFVDVPPPVNRLLKAGRRIAHRGAVA